MARVTMKEAARRVMEVANAAGALAKVAHDNDVELRQAIDLVKAVWRRLHRDDLAGARKLAKSALYGKGK